MNPGVVDEGHDLTTSVLVISANGGKGVVHELLEDVGVLGAVQHLNRDHLIL